MSTVVYIWNPVDGGRTLSDSSQKQMHIIIQYMDGGYCIARSADVREPVVA